MAPNAADGAPPVYSADRSQRPLVSGFIRSAQEYPRRPALDVGGETFTYSELSELAGSIAATLAEGAGGRIERLTAVLAGRSVVAYAGVLGALMRGHGYVPLNPGFPADRTREMLLRAGCRELVVDSECVDQLEQILDGVPPLRLILPTEPDVSRFAKRWPGHDVLGERDLISPRPLSLSKPQDPAYVLFTSGSTGRPKGVVVSQRNVSWFVDAVVNRYDVSCEDRLSQTFDLTFDLSAFDMFVTWERGACLCCPTHNELLMPARFANAKGLTIWFSVPSVGVFAKRLGSLREGALPTLRWSLFCGEPLPAEVATAWQQAAQRSVVENLYGPTEATIACTAYRWDPESSPSECYLGIVPIGSPLPGTTLAVVDDRLREVPSETEGELLIGGPQVSDGYLDDPDKTRAAFVNLAGRSGVYYRTGDRVKRPAKQKAIVYVGRLDHQLKIRGHRVELGEVEAAVREASGSDGVVAIGWPVSTRGADGIVAFVAGKIVDAAAIEQQVRRRLPDYMTPTLRCLESLPVNANGKYDRHALRALLEAE